MKNVKEERRREKRSRILDEAGKLFVLNGIESTKIIDIAKATGVAKGTVYEYFESKEDIVIEWMNGTFGEFRSNMQEKLSCEDNAVSKLRVFLEYSAEEFTSIMVNTKIIMQQRFEDICRRYSLEDSLEDSIDKVAGDRIASVVLDNVKIEFELLNAIIREGQDSGELRKDINLSIMPFFILSILPFLGMTKNPDFPEEYLERRFNFKRPEWTGEEIISYIVDGIGKRS